MTTVEWRGLLLHALGRTVRSLNPDSPNPAIGRGGGGGKVSYKMGSDDYYAKTGERFGPPAPLKTSLLSREVFSHVS